MHNRRGKRVETESKFTKTVIVGGKILTSHLYNMESITMHSHVIELPIVEIQAYCTTQPIQRLSLFGSVLREDYSPKSDVDILVEFLPNAQVGYFKLGEIQEALEQLVGREVDLLTLNALSEHFRQDVLDVAQVIYEKE